MITENENTLKLIGRENLLFTTDVNSFSKDLKDIISVSTFLVLGGAG